jgi:hypothetical protein
MGRPNNVGGASVDTGACHNGWPLSSVNLRSAPTADGLIIQMLLAWYPESNAEKASARFAKVNRPATPVPPVIVDPAA